MPSEVEEELPSDEELTDAGELPESEELPETEAPAETEADEPLKLTEPGAGGGVRRARREVLFLQPAFLETQCPRRTSNR